eukprot:62183-Rhodomonas_salina.1
MNCVQVSRCSAKPNRTQTAPRQNPNRTQTQETRELLTICIRRMGFQPRDLPAQRPHSSPNNHAIAS